MRITAIVALLMTCVAAVARADSAVAATVGQETVQYVGNSYKYYVVYSTLMAKP